MIGISRHVILRCSSAAPPRRELIFSNHQKAALYLLEVKEQETRRREILPLQAIRIDGGNTTKIGKMPKQKTSGLYDAKI